MLTQHAEFVELLRGFGADVLIGEPIDGLVDAVYTHDPAVMTPHGSILLQMRKPVRSAEPAAMRADFERLGVPILGALTGDAVSDGGDKVWLDARTLVVGRGYRTNASAVAQFRAMLEPHGVSVISVDLPHYLGPDAVLHLMSVISPIAPDLAVVYEHLAPVALLELLDERGIARITVDEDEMLTQGANILAVAPGEVVGRPACPRSAAPASRARPGSRPARCGPSRPRRPGSRARRSPQRGAPAETSSRC